jgi:hypothetical protein
MEMASNDDN